MKTRWALKDGKISVSERRLLWFLGVSTSLMLLADLIVVIWVGEQTSEIHCAPPGLCGGVQ